jgi:hypothetical protein
MVVTIAPGCFDPNAPTDPDWEDLDEDFDPSSLTGHSKDGWEADPQFRVVTESVERAANALMVVAERFMYVGFSGTEYDPAGPIDREDYTPNTSRVHVDNEAAYVSADTKGWLSHEMAGTMKRILVEELTRAGVSATISEDYNPVRWSDAETWPRRD